MRVRQDRHCWTANGRLTDVEVLRRPGIRSKLAIHRKLGILRQVLICRDLVILMKHVILWQHVILMRHVILWHYVIHRSGIGVRNGKAEASIALIIGLKSITKKKKNVVVLPSDFFLGECEEVLPSFLFGSCIFTNPVGVTTCASGGDLFQKLHSIVPKPLLPWRQRRCRQQI